MRFKMIKQEVPLSEFSRILEKSGLTMKQIKNIWKELQSHNDVVDREEVLVVIKNDGKR